MLCPAFSFAAICLINMNIKTKGEKCFNISVCNFGYLFKNAASQKQKTLKNKIKIAHLIYLLGFYFIMIN